MISHFFNEYGYETQNGWTGINAQLKEAGYDDSKVENIFGKGWSDNGVYPTVQNIGKEGTFMSRNEQLAAVDSDLDINNYELVFGKGYVKKTEESSKKTEVHYSLKEGEGYNVTVSPDDLPTDSGVPTEVKEKQKNRGNQEIEQVVVSEFTFENNQYVGEMDSEPVDTNEYILVCREGVNEKEYTVLWVNDDETPNEKLTGE